MASVLFHVQHLLGIGHLRRAATLARAMARAGLEVDFVSGGEPVPGLDLGGARLRQLPPARAADADFSAIIGQNGRPIDDAFRADRCALVLSLYQSIRPDIVLVEMFPFGRQQFKFELIPLLEAALADPRRPIVASSVRDILVEKKRPDRLAAIVELVRRYFSLVLVHGDPGIVTFQRTFARAGDIADLIAHTGFVVERPARSERPPADRQAGEVLVSAGGGAVGSRLFQSALAAKPHSKYRDRVWRVITGTHLGEREAASIRAMAAADRGIVVESFRPDFQRLLEACVVSISQAGYNTLLELIAAGTPALVVPFATLTENEQALRASLFAERGLIGVMDEAELSPVTFARAIDSVPAPPSHAIDLGGADRSAGILIDRLRAARTG